MKKTKLTRSLLAAVSIVALTAVMYGCTHDSDDPPATDGMEMETPAEQIAALQEQINTLRAELGLDPIDIDDLTGSVANLTQQVADLQKQIDDAQDAEDKAAAEAAAKDAMALFGGMGDTDTLSVTIAASNAVTDVHGGGMAGVTATGDGLVPGVGRDDVMKSAEPMLGMWQGTMLTDANAADAATNPGTSSTVVVYTDIAAPKPVAFDTVYDLDGNGNLPNTALLAADNRSKIMASDFMHTGKKDHAPDAGADDDAVDVMIRGTFNGAAGEYRCAAAAANACVSHDAGDGAVRLEGSTWIFDPDSGAMAMMVDPSFAYFGWWLNKGTADDVEAGVFHGVTDLTGDEATLGPAIATNFTPLGGKATYKGSAAGKYAINPSISTASGGHWTADATLTADFGDEAANGTISGMVENFMAGGEMMDWSVALGATTFTDGTGAFNTTSDNSGDTASNAVVWTIGGVNGAVDGSWSGGLRGEGDNNVPTVATGQFMATHMTVDTVVGRMVGAFGAHLDE